MRVRSVAPCLLFLGFLACGGSKIEVSLQQARVETGSSNQSFLSVDILATGDGKAIPCNGGEVEVVVGVSSSEDGPFKEVPSKSLMFECTDDEGPDIGLAVDNSGSERGMLDWLQQAARVALDTIEPMGGRASLVRVSTNSEVTQELTDDFDALHEAVGDLFVANGWTALYDGIRMANETLGGSHRTRSGHHPPDLTSFCTSDRKIGVVAFTDAKENNSADEHPADRYPGDSINTTLDDLYNLRVNDVPTPVYTVGLGSDVDHEALEQLAAATGGRHHRVADAEDLPGVFQLIADYNFSNIKVCSELPDVDCGTVFVRIQYTWTRCAGSNCDRNLVRDERIFAVNVDCPVNRNGRDATILLTLSDPGIDKDVAKSLAARTVKWVSGLEAPKVLVVKDDNHHGEDEGDAAYVTKLLKEADISAELIDEPRWGLRLSRTEDYDVVWLSNPGYPPDDRRTLYTLKQVSEQGKGYVLQGDDMTRFWCDSGFSMTPLTGLVHESNGTSFCGERIDNNDSERRYRVALDSTTHAAIAGIGASEFFYGNDIDNSHLAGQGETRLAGAVGTESTGGAVYCDTDIPVIVVRESDSP